MNATLDTLDTLMEFDHVITVHEDLTVTDGDTAPQAPESVYDYLDSTGQSANDEDFSDSLTVRNHTWQLMTGYSGQYSYSGPVMHSSEFIGGGLARAILSTPGYYVALTVTGIHPDDCECEENEYHGDNATDSDTYGWAVAFLPL